MSNLFQKDILFELFHVQISLIQKLTLKNNLKLVNNFKWFTLLNHNNLVELWLIFILFLLYCIFQFLSMFPHKIKSPQIIKITYTLNISILLIGIHFNSQDLKDQYIEYTLWIANPFNNLYWASATYQALF